MIVLTAATEYLLLRGEVLQDSPVDAKEIERLVVIWGPLLADSKAGKERAWRVIPKNRQRLAVGTTQGCLVSQECPTKTVAPLALLAGLCRYL